VAVAYTQAVFVGWGTFTLGQFAGATAASLAYGLLSTHAVQTWLQRTSSVLQIFYFVLQAILAATVIYLFQAIGFIGLIVLPLASQAVLFLLAPWSALGFALALASVLVPIGILGGWLAIFQGGLAYLAGLVFVALFTRIVLDERQANHEAQRLAVELRTANQKLREYASQVEELAAAKERNWLAREIHDSLGHYLTVINVQLEAARAVCQRDPEKAIQVLAKAQALTQEGLREVRSSVAALRQSPLEGRPLAQAIGLLLQGSHVSGLVVNFETVGKARPLSHQADLALYRAAQEGLTNVGKHARANQAKLTLDYSPDHVVRLVLQDNGVGANNPQGGFGLLGLRERVQLLGGQLRTSSKPGIGFTLEVEIPA
jgi:signal transduction histidine kinase